MINQIQNAHVCTVVVLFSSSVIYLFILLNDKFEVKLLFKLLVWNPLNLYYFDRLIDQVMDDDDDDEDKDDEDVDGSDNNDVITRRFLVSVVFPRMYNISPQSGRSTYNFSHALNGKRVDIALQITTLLEMCINVCVFVCTNIYTHFVRSNLVYLLYVMFGKLAWLDRISINVYLCVCYIIIERSLCLL